MNQTAYEKHFLNVKRLIPFIFSIFLLIPVLHAQEINHEFNSYEEARKSPDYVKFQNTSTKLGFITTDFDGYAKKIKITYKLNASVVEKLEVVVPVKSLDTDNDSRNEKMWDDILNAKEFPIIFVTLAAPLTLSEGEKTVDMSFKIKENEIIRPVKLVISKAGERFLIKGETNLGVKEMKIPDPSIAIAKVKDTFDLKFAVRFP